MIFGPVSTVPKSFKISPPLAKSVEVYNFMGFMIKGSEANKNLEQFIFKECTQITLLGFIIVVLVDV